MSRRFNEHPRESGSMTWSDVPRLYWIAIGVVVLVGLVGGSLFIGWTLFRIHVLGIQP